MASKRGYVSERVGERIQADFPDRFLLHSHPMTAQLFFFEDTKLPGSSKLLASSFLKENAKIRVRVLWS